MNGPAKLDELGSPQPPNWLSRLKLQRFDRPPRSRRADPQFLTHRLHCLADRLVRMHVLLPGQRLHHSVGVRDGQETQVSSVHGLIRPSFESRIIGRTYQIRETFLKRARWLWGKPLIRVGV